MKGKVLIVSSPFFDYQLSVAHAFEELGYEVEVETYDEPIHPFKGLLKWRHKFSHNKEALRQKSRIKYNAYICERFQAFSPDLVFIYNGNILFDETLDFFRKSSKVLLWMYDSVLRKDRTMCLTHIDHVDAFFCFERKDVDYYQNIGKTAYFLPLACDTHVYFPIENNMCRVIEVWEKRAVVVIDYWDHADGEEGEWNGTIEEIEAINNARIQKFQSLGVPEEDWLLIEYDESTSFKWFYKFLTPFGEVLREGISPYKHGSHPFVFYPYPLIDGEIWGFVEDFIDQQKQVNRLYTLQDFTLGTSAKNTLVLDKDSLAGQLPEDISATYREIGGVIVLDYKGGKNQPPKELTGKGVIAGVTEMIGMQLKWMQDISGVQPALQGQSGSAGTPASKYAMETQNATLNVKGFLDAFNWFRKERDEKLLSTIVQFYKTERYLAISGNVDENDKMYDPSLLEGDAGEFTLTIGQSSDNPTYKGWMDEMLKELVINNMIDMEMFLKHSNFPFSKALLEDITNRKEQLGAGAMNPQQAVAGLSQTFNNQVQNDPNYSQEKVNQLYKMMSQKAA